MSYSFEVRINIKSELDSFHPLNKENIYFKREDKSYIDNIMFELDIITITGSRTAKIDSEKSLYSSLNSIFKGIIKSLTYRHFKFGGFEVVDIVFIQNENIRNEKGIVQRFKKKMDLEIDEEVFEKIFSDHKVSEPLVNSLVYLNLSDYTNDFSFENLWRSFNSISRLITNKDKDYDQIKKMKDIIKNKETYFKSSIDKSKELLDYYLENNEDFYIFINRKKNIINPKVIDNLIKQREKNSLSSSNLEKEALEYKDERILSIYQSYIEEYCLRKNDVKVEKEYAEIILKIKNNKQENNLYDADILCFYIDYIYFLRCEYFHASKMDWNYLYSTEETELINNLTGILREFIVDCLNFQFSS